VTRPAPAAPAAVALPADVAAYCLRLGDDALVAAQRLGEWVSRAPEMEEDLALANIALDLLGQARSLLTRAGDLEAAADGAASARTEDDLAYLRGEREFRCIHLVELPRGDFALTVARLLVFSGYQAALYRRLAGSIDPVLAGVAAKATKEVAYHLGHAVQWTLRLGDGTAESHRRMQAGLDAVWPYVAELFDDDELTTRLADAGAGVLPSELRAGCESGWRDVIAEAGLGLPAPVWRSRGGRDGIHTEHLGLLLAELQSVARSHPGATW